MLKVRDVNLINSCLARDAFNVAEKTGKVTMRNLIDDMGICDAIAGDLAYALRKIGVLKLVSMGINVMGENVAKYRSVMHGTHFICSDCTGIFDRNQYNYYRKRPLCDECVRAARVAPRGTFEYRYEAPKKIVIDEKTFAGLADENLDIPTRNIFKSIG